MWLYDKLADLPHYKVGSNIFTSKFLASIKSKELNLPMTWHFYDNVWKSFDLNSFPPGNLREVYKQRALQLRDKYDYLVLNYSGGVDSWTVLNTFLTNKIKLDQITVRYPWKYIDKKLHNPNKENLTEFNRFSEWDFTAKPDLEKLSITHPEIKIHLQDYFEDNILLTPVNDNAFEEIHCQYGFGSTLRGRAHRPSPFELKIMGQDKRVGLITGVDKPRVAVKNNKFYYYFADNPILINPYFYDSELRKMEYFYWTPDFPEVLYTQLKVLYNWLLLNPQYVEYITVENLTTATWRYYSFFIKSIIYPDWDHSRFQCEKPSYGETGLVKTRPTDYLFEQHPEIKPLTEKFHYLRKSYDPLLNPDHLYKNGEFKKFASKAYYLGDIPKG